jgi:glycerol-3-phosphate acyltransferase PlsX
MDKTAVVFEVATSEQGLAEMLHGATLALREMKRPLDLHLVVYDEDEARALAARELMVAAAQVGAEIAFHAAPDRVPERVESPIRVHKSCPGNPIRTAFLVAREVNGVVISPGNTGLVMAGALYEFGRLPGIERPPIAAPWPTLGKTLFVLDAGANVDIRPQHLVQFAHIGKVYVERIFDRANPRIGLLSNGSEEYKGNSLVRDTHRLLSEDSGINFAGYIEGQTVFEGNVDILLMDGFIGNILLKFAEGLAASINRVLRDEIRTNPLSAFLAWLFFQPSLRRFKKRFDYTEFGGAPLLGVKGNVVISHGRSDAIALKNAIRWAVRMLDEDIAARIEREIGEKSEQAQLGNSGRGL